MRIVAALFLAATLTSVSAHAQVVDLSTIKCKEFIESDKNTIGSIMMWLDGYYTDEDDPAVVDFDKMKKKGAELGEYCAKNPTLGLMTAADKVMSK